MKALRLLSFALLSVSLAFGQYSKLREANEKLYSFSEFNAFPTSASDAILMPKVVAETTYDVRQERINRDLEKIFAPRKQISFTVISDSSGGSWLRHSLEESPVVEFAMMSVQDVKKLKGGFTLKNPFGGPDLNAYLKSGIAWKARENKHLTYTLGRRISRRYDFKDENDIFDAHIKVPIEKFNARIEKTFGGLIDIFQR